MSARGWIALVAAIALTATALPAAADAAGCRGRAPRHVTFARKHGHTVGLLRWWPPRHDAHGIRYRVLRLRWRAPRRRARRIHHRVLGNRTLIGQTKRHRIGVSVRLGRTYRFVVAPVSRRGRVSRCVARRRIRIKYRPPGPPMHLRVSGTETKLRARWRPGRRGDGKLQGYRLLRNGQTLDQTRHTTEKVSVSPYHTYKFVVKAVDRRGHLSRPSNTVTVKTNHVVPTTPRGVLVGAISTSEIGVSWSPSSVASGRVVGYRVYVNGAVAHQFQGTSALIGHLTPGTSYSISVAAVDNYGMVSSPSAPVRTQTISAQPKTPSPPGQPPSVPPKTPSPPPQPRPPAQPTPSTGHAQAFILATTDQSYLDFEAHYQEIGVIYPTYYTCNAAGAIEGTNNLLWTRWAQARSVRVLPRINCQSATVVDRILTDNALRAQWLDQLVGLVQSNGYDGLAIDFESGPPQDRAALTSFIADLAQRLHANGKLLSISVSAKTYDNPKHPRSGIFDYPALSQSADWVVVMCWGLHWATSAPGSQDDITWVKQILGYVATLPLHQKFVAAFNLYAMDWPDGGGADHPATSYEYGAEMPRLASFGASTQRDPTTDSLHATYTDSQGVSHDVWYEDSTTEADRIPLVTANRLGGIAFWRLGLEDQRLWSNPQLAPGATL